MMFNRLVVSDPETILTGSAGVIAGWLEKEWEARRGVPTRAGGGPPTFSRRMTSGVGFYDHLIYAALIEITGAESIMRRVVFEAAHGERLGTITSNVTYSWLETTERLFFSFGVSFNPVSTVSQVRPSEKSTRLNAIQRFFGSPLLPGGSETTYPFERPEVANVDFVPTFNRFLREFWLAYANTKNAVGPNTTDFSAIATIARRLRTMLNERRGGSNISRALDRQEFSAVAEMSWFHFLLSSNNAVLQDLDSTGSDPAERLNRLGKRVGVTPHPSSTGLFILAPIMSKLLIAIEAGLYDTDVGVAQLLVAPQVGDMLEIVNHWEIISQESTKATPVLSGTTSAPSTPTSLLATR